MKKTLVTGAIGLSLLSFTAIIPLQFSTQVAYAASAPIDLIQGHDWSHFSGATVSGNTVVIQGIGRAIVPESDNDDQTTIKNPPINLRGTYLKVSGDFSVTTAIQVAANTSASFMMYGTLPLIQDEWRQEGKTLTLTINKGKLYVEVLDGNSNKPTKGTFGSNLSRLVTLKTVSANNKFTFYANGNKIGELSNPGVFIDGHVFFGADASVGGSYTINSLSAQAESASASVNAVDNQILAIPQTNHSLRSLAEKHVNHLRIGTAVASIPLLTDPSYTQILGREFNTVTPENDMKFQFIHPQPNQYAFAEADALVEFAQKNNMAVHGHELAWNEALPRWLTETKYTSAQIKDILIDHINTVVGHYKGKIKDWDVINEPFNDSSGSFRTTSPWYKALGTDYIELSLQTAHAADPNARLYINEYGVEEKNSKSDALYKLAKGLLAKGVPLHGIGFQLHEDIGKGYTPVTDAVFKSNLKRFTDLGLEVRISEMDVNIQDKVTNALSTQQANYYASMLQVAADNPTFTTFSVWGFTDRYSSLSPWEYFKYADGLIYDTKFKPKKAYQSLLDVLANK
ncbi:endo-1,4-beta-xylanase [Paenibacillus sp. SYP-B3998]|uniref:Beta-xylanase n=1 Tax=Paenibacillus sp. SYP-B3998 TaxID=2678564 RepID=A0A6G4A2E5_9BACL|nr:endo-1,4-beta-xylanase [Paenibacillus sp. SYP-B3998]NEW08666.1 endo-1,4-beta-xylanase [Paenibacillus sp. SYP-B3998]